MKGVCIRAAYLSATFRNAWGSSSEASESLLPPLLASCSHPGCVPTGRVAASMSILSCAIQKADCEMCGSGVPEEVGLSEARTRKTRSRWRCSRFDLGKRPFPCECQTRFGTAISFQPPVLQFLVNMSTRVRRCRHALLHILPSC